MKDMTSVANTIMTDEEKAEVEGAASANHISASASAPATTSAPTDNSHANGPAHAAADATSSGTGGQPSNSLVHHASSDDAAGPSTSSSTPPTPASPNHPTTTSSTPTPHSAKKRPKLTPEQREKLAVHERERKRALEVRVRTLTEKLVDRLRPFVEAKNPGANGDPETAAWEARMRREADDLKLESFGVELLHAIGTVYVTKASSYLKSRKFLGM
jgi:X-domain of DnaJ-containing